MLEGIVIWSKIGGWWKVIGVEYVDDDVHRGEYGGNIHIYMDMVQMFYIVLVLQ